MYMIGLPSIRINIRDHRKEDSLYHTISGEGIFIGSYRGDSTVKVEWRQVEKVILPYKEVY